VFDYEQFKHKKKPFYQFTDVAESLNLAVLHQENDFNEFEREALIPHKMSSEGPALAVADINHDGLEDVFLGSSKTSMPRLFLQNPNGKFRESKQVVFQKDSIMKKLMQMGRCK